MKKIFHTLLLLATAVITAGGMSACSGERYNEPEVPDSVMLTIRVKLSGNNPYSRAVGDEYEPDKEAKDGEKMHTLRIIILDQNGVVEHNSLWDAWSQPVIESGIKQFKVKSNEDKTIIFVANESGTIITDADGNTFDASDYFARFSPSVGSIINVNDLRELTMSSVQKPLAINDIYSYHIGSEPNYSATFYIGRAAVKYTFRITNKDDSEHTLSSLTIGRVASMQYYFQNAVFTDDKHLTWSSYSTPASASTTDMVIKFETPVSIPNDGKTYEFGPYYVPEGATYATPYQVGVSMNGIDLGMHDISWNIPQTPDNKTLMLDLPRNTHVITEINLNNTMPVFNYTICRWDEYKIDIPDFN